MKTNLKTMGRGDIVNSSSPKARLPASSPEESTGSETLKNGHTRLGEGSGEALASSAFVNHRTEDLHREVSKGDVATDANNNVIVMPALSQGSEPGIKSSITNDGNGLEVTGAEVTKSAAEILPSMSNSVNCSASSHSKPHYQPRPPSSAPPYEGNQSEVGQSVVSTPSGLSFTPLDVTSYTECGVIYEGDSPVRVFAPYSRGYYPEDESYRNSRVDSSGTSSFLWHSLPSPPIKYPPPSVWGVVAPSTTPPQHPHPSLYSVTSLSISENPHTNGCPASLPPAPVELQVTNLDQNIDAREMKKILFSFFREHVMVLHVSMLVQSDGNLAASLRVPSAQDAQYAISQLHRKKIGAKRIIISYVNHNQPSPELKRSKVISLLQEVPGKKLPLFKFRELYERRFHETIGVSEMYNMRDVVTVSDNSIGRMVALHPEYRHMSQAALTYSLPEPSGVTRFCTRHSSGPDASIGWAERDNTICLPNVRMTLKTLANTIPVLMESHDGLIPLISLVDCYTAEVGSVEEVFDAGVPFEHLVSCLPDVSIDTSVGGFKFIQWAKNKPLMDDLEDLARFVSPPLVGQLALFSRELVDLMKTFPHTRLPFPRFIPAYHHHFGRQCRVADYGFTKLAELFDALPHVVQVLGEGNRRVITLAHRAQIKRFSSDLLRVLKSQPAKVILLSQFSLAYAKTIGKCWDVTDYGVNDIDDLLSEVNETTVLVRHSTDDVTIAIPKREQTPDEIERTRQFAAEVVELLRHSPQCKMHFNRFIPAYHHHFGRQCRVADYGFTKLIELFEAIPDLLEIFDDEEDGEKQLQLVEKERLRVLGEQLVVVVKGSPRQCLSVEALRQVFTHYYGYALRPNQYGHNSLNSLLQALNNYIEVSGGDGEALVRAVDRCPTHTELTRARALLWQQPDSAMPLDDFVALYKEKYGVQPNISLLAADVDQSVTVAVSGGRSTVQLSPLQVFARDLLSVLQDAGGRMLLTNFETAYLDKLGIPCRPARYGFASVVALVQALSDLVTVKGRGVKKLLLLLPVRDGAENTPCTGGFESGDHSRWKGGPLPQKDVGNNIVTDSTSDAVSLTTNTTNGSNLNIGSSNVDEHSNCTSGKAEKGILRYDKCFVSGRHLPGTVSSTGEVAGSRAVSDVHQVNGEATTTRSISLSTTVFNGDLNGNHTTALAGIGVSNFDRSLDSPFEFPFKLLDQSKASNLNRRSSLENGPGVFSVSKDHFQSTLMKATSLQILGGVSNKEETNHPISFTSETTVVNNGTSSILARVGSLFSSNSAFSNAGISHSQTIQKSLLQSSYKSSNVDGNAILRSPTVNNVTPSSHSLGPLQNGNFQYGHRNARVNTGDIFEKNGATNRSSFPSNFLSDKFSISNNTGSGKTSSYGRPCTSTPHASTDSTDENGTETQLATTNDIHTSYDKFRQSAQGNKVPYTNRDQTNLYGFTSSYSAYQSGYRGSSQDSRLSRNRVSSNSYNSGTSNGTSRNARGTSMRNPRISNESDNGFRNESPAVSFSQYRESVPRTSYGGSPRRTYGSGYDGLQYYTRRPSFSRPPRSQSSYSNYHAAKHNGQYRDGPQSQRTDSLPVPGTGGMRGTQDGPSGEQLYCDGSSYQGLCEQSKPQLGVPIPGRGRSDISHSPPYDFQTCLPDGGGVFMSMPPPQAQAYQSSLMFSGSPVAGGGASVMWGQIWSPAAQYPTVIASPMSPAHYVIPSGLSVSWSSIATSPPNLPMTLPPHTPPASRHTISMHTLDHPAQCGYNVPPPSELGTALLFPQSAEMEGTCSEQLLPAPHTFLVQQPPRPPPPFAPVSQTLNSTQPIFFGPAAPHHPRQPMTCLSDVNTGPFSPPQNSFTPGTINSPFDIPPHSATSRPSTDLSSTVCPPSVSFGMCAAPTYSFANTMPFENPYTMSEVLPTCSLDSNIFSPMFVPSFTSCAPSEPVSFAPVQQSSLTYPTSNAGSPATEHATACVDSLISPLINPDFGVEISPQVGSPSTVSSLAAISTSVPPLSVSCGSGVISGHGAGDSDVLNATPGPTSRRLAAQFTNRVVGSSVTEGGPTNNGQSVGPTEVSIHLRRNNAFV